MKNAERDKPISVADWHKLLNRYYNGETTHGEEQWLEEWLTSSQAEATTAKADRALFAYRGMAQRKANKDTGRKRIGRKQTALQTVFRVAAVLLLMALPLAYLISEENANIEVAYIHGEKQKDKQIILFQLEQTISDLNLTIDQPEKTLQDMFSPLMQ